MRPSLVLAFTLVPATAFAGGHVASGGGGGRLSQVSSGLGTATSGAPSGGSSSPVRDHRGTDDEAPPGTSPPPERALEPGEDLEYRAGGQYIVTAEGMVVRTVVAPPQGPANEPARFDGFLGVSDTFESNAAASLSLAVTDSKLRLSGAVTRYWENQVDEEVGTLTLTAVSLQLGLKLPSTGSIEAFVQGGMMYAKTANDVMSNSAITGASVGLHVEHAGPYGSRMIGDARAIRFGDGIDAFEGRLEVRSHHLEAGIRVLDFDVGPALFGPEVGIAF